MEIVAFAVTEAIHIGAVGFDAVKQIALARIERRPRPVCDLAAYPHLPKMDGEGDPGRRLCGARAAELLGDVAA